MALLSCSSFTPSSLKSLTVLEELEKNQSAAEDADGSPDSVKAPVLAFTVGLEPPQVSLLPPLRSLPPPDALPLMRSETFWANVSADCSSAKIDISASWPAVVVALYVVVPAMRMSEREPPVILPFPLPPINKPPPLPPTHVLAP